MKRKERPSLSPNERMLANINDRFYRWPTDFVFHPERLCWVIPVSSERNFRLWTWYAENGTPLPTALDAFDLAIVVAYEAAKRNMEMYAQWKLVTDTCSGAEALNALAQHPLTAPVKFLYDLHAKERHEQLREEIKVLQTEFQGAKERAFYVPPPTAAVPEAPRKKHVLPATFRKAIEEKRKVN